MILEKLKTWGLLALGFLVTVLAAFGIGRYRGRSTARQEAEQEAQHRELERQVEAGKAVGQAAEDRRQVDDQVQQLEKDDARKALRDRWADR